MLLGPGSHTGKQTLTDTSFQLNHYPALEQDHVLIQNQMPQIPSNSGLVPA